MQGKKCIKKPRQWRVSINMYNYSATDGASGVAVSEISPTISVRKSLCCAAILDFDETNANAAHNTKNITANHAVKRVRKLPAAAPVNMPPNIDDADEPEIPLPSDFCNKISPVINTDTMINKTNKIENIFFPLGFFVFRF